MYFIAAGEVVAVREEGDRSEVELERMGSGKSFGEAVLFEDLPRSATVRAESRCHLLAIHKREIEEAVREFPDIALHACKVLSERVRALESKASGPWYCRI
jgi:CRP-like cAMP-binding protein